MRRKLEDNIKLDLRCICCEEIREWRKWYSCLLPNFDIGVAEGTVVSASDVRLSHDRVQGPRLALNVLVCIQVLFLMSNEHVVLLSARLRHWRYSIGCLCCNGSAKCLTLAILDCLDLLLKLGEFLILNCLDLLLRLGEFIIVSIALLRHCGTELLVAFV
jgi:hypothetical protein